MIVWSATPVKRGRWLVSALSIGSCSSPERITGAHHRSGRTEAVDLDQDVPRPRGDPALAARAMFELYIEHLHQSRSRGVLRLLFHGAREIQSGAQKIRSQPPTRRGSHYGTCSPILRGCRGSVRSSVRLLGFDTRGHRRRGARGGDRRGPRVRPRDEEYVPGTKDVYQSFGVRGARSGRRSGSAAGGLAPARVIPPCRCVRRGTARTGRPRAGGPGRRSATATRRSRSAGSR